MRNLLYTLLATTVTLGLVALVRPDLNPIKDLMSSETPFASQESVVNEVSPSESSSVAATTIPDDKLPELASPGVAPTHLETTHETVESPSTQPPVATRAAELSSPATVDATTSERRSPLIEESSTKEASLPLIDAGDRPIGTGLSAASELPPAAPFDATADSLHASLQTTSSTSEQTLNSSPDAAANPHLTLPPPLAGPAATVNTPGAVSAASELLAPSEPETPTETASAGPVAPPLPRMRVTVHAATEPDPAPEPRVSSGIPAAPGSSLVSVAEKPVELAESVEPTRSASETPSLETNGRTDQREPAATGAIVVAAPQPGYAQRDAEAAERGADAEPARPTLPVRPSVGPNVVRPATPTQASGSPADTIVGGEKHSWRRRWQAFLGAPVRGEGKEDLPGDTQLPTAELHLGQQDAVRERNNPLIPAFNNLPGDNEPPVVTRDQLNDEDEPTPTFLKANGSPDNSSPTETPSPLVKPALETEDADEAAADQSEAAAQQSAASEESDEITRGRAPERQMALLPPTERPHDDSDVADLVEEDQERDIALHAGGTICLRPPLGWHVSEVSAGRQVRLLVTPQQVGARTVAPRDGLWLTVHVRRESVIPAKDEMVAMLPLRLRAVARTGLVEGPRELLEIDRWPALQQDFVVETPAEASPAEPSDESEKQRQAGFHLLVRTNWGIVEAHAETPAGVGEDRLHQLVEMTREMKLVAPRPHPTAKVGHVQDATPIFGSWKSYKGRFRFLPDGQVTLTFDRAGVYALDSAGKADVSRRLRQQTGTYHADGDLLRIVWKDGTKLNLRWREHQHQLLLTDHTGQTHRLARLLD